MSAGMITVEVAYALPDRQEICTLTVPEGTSVYEAVKRSPICELFPELDPGAHSMGIFGKVVKDPKEHHVRDGDRVEIYRPLLIDPKEARLNRARKKK